MRRQIAVFLIGMLAPQLVSAQALTPGSRVRVSHPGEGTGTGTVVAMSDDTLEVLLKGRTQSVHLPLDEVTRLEVSRGKQRHMSDAAVGLLVGASVGAVAGYVGGDNDCSHEIICFDRRTTAAMGGIFFGGVGGVIGLIKGVIPTESWERVHLQPRRVSLVTPGRAGPLVGLRIAF